MYDLLIPVIVTCVIVYGFHVEAAAKEMAFVRSFWKRGVDRFKLVVHEVRPLDRSIDAS